MKDSLLFEFTVDKATNQVFVNRQFAAELDLVWQAFTTKEMLDKWWAPKPWLSKTKRMNFIAGGRRFYAMVSPEGQEHWSIQEFTSITPKTNFRFFDAFTDRDENINPDLPGSNWDLQFSELNEHTTVEIAIKHKTLADLEKIIEMGFKEGFMQTLTELDRLLIRLK
jgi:uncharacterized protein YndB with AHSA1/START domain